MGFYGTVTLRKSTIFVDNFRRQPRCRREKRDVMLESGETFAAAWLFLPETAAPGACGFWGPPPSAIVYAVPEFI
jgi:hypothetical protein